MVRMNPPLTFLLLLLIPTTIPYLSHHFHLRFLQISTPTPNQPTSASFQRSTSPNSTPQHLNCGLPKPNLTSKCTLLIYPCGCVLPLCSSPALPIVGFSPSRVVSKMPIGQPSVLCSTSVSTATNRAMPSSSLPHQVDRLCARVCQKNLLTSLNNYLPILPIQIPCPIPPDSLAGSALTYTLLFLFNALLTSMLLASSPFCMKKPLS